MALNVSAWAIRKPIPSLVLFFMLIPAGWASFLSLPVTNMPAIDMPMVSVTVVQAGAAPAELETQVTKKVEAAVANLPGVKHITSTTGDSVSTTTVEFQLETPTDRAVADVRDAVSNIAGALPPSAEEPVIQRIEVEGGAVAAYAATSSSKTPEELSWFIDDSVSRTLQGVRGVAQVRREGGMDREIRVALDSRRLQALDVTAAEINTQLGSTNLDVAGGRAALDDQEQSIRTLGGATSIEALAATRIILPGNRQVTLGDIGSVRDGAAEARSAARLNGEPVVAFSIYRAKGHSDIAVAEGVEEKLAELFKAHPDITFSLIQTSVTDIQGPYDSAMTTLIEGAVLAVIVVFLFLRDFRATIIAALAIPLSIIPTFFVVHMLGFSLNTISLLAITVVTGVLVDDAIVEIENIVRHMRMGKSAYHAAITAADEIGLAVVATTATIVAVFVPVSFMGGVAGQYFRQFGLTVAIAVAFSLLVARLITPILAAYFMRASPHLEQRDGFVLRSYTRVLRWTLRWRFATVAAGFAVVAGTIVLASMLSSDYLPEDDNSRSTLNIEMPPGATMAQTEKAVIEITRILRRTAEVESVYATVGGSSSGTAEVRKGIVVINLVPRARRSVGQKEFEAKMGPALAGIPDMRSHFSNGMGGREFVMILSGPDSETIERAATALDAAIRSRVPLLRNVLSTVAIERPEIRIIPKLAEAAALGVSVAHIAETVEIATIGDTSRNLAKFSIDGRQIDIRVQLDEAARSEISTFEGLRVRRDNGDTVPLTAVADIGLGLGPTVIDRYDRERRVMIEGDLAKGAALGDALAAVQALPEARNLPAGVSLRESGDAELMGEVYSGFVVAMAAGLLLVLTVLILLFADVIQPVTILLSLPLSVSGAFIALLLTGNAIGLSVIIGFLMLMGIVTKNAILLVDFAIIEIAQGVERANALINAGRKRAQPIIMTTVAMSAGMVPSALAPGDDGSFRSPMAIAVIGGLITSTILSLIFVPALFTIMDDAGRGFRWLFGRFVGPADERSDNPAGQVVASISRAQQ
jgi:HAE1 family hydrophobic/amphiphilic exporter-1